MLNLQLGFGLKVMEKPFLMGELLYAQMQMVTSM